MFASTRITLKVSEPQPAFNKHATLDVAVRYNSVHGGTCNGTLHCVHLPLTPDDLAGLIKHVMGFMRSWHRLAARACDVRKASRMPIAMVVAE